MGGRSRLRIFGNRIRHARIGLQRALERARPATCKAGAAEYRPRSAQRERAGPPAQFSRAFAQDFEAAHGWPELMCYPPPHPSSWKLDAPKRIYCWTLRPAASQHDQADEKTQNHPMPGFNRRLGMRIIAMEERNNG